MESNTGEEDHAEPASEGIRSSVVGAEHPLFSTSGIKTFLNKGVSLSATSEDQITGDVKDQTFKDLLKSAYRNKFPFDILCICADITNKMDKRSGASDADSIINKLTGYVKELNSTLSRQPLNYEVLAAYMLESASSVKTVRDNAQNNPDKESIPLGSKFDKYIFYKSKFGNDKLRSNKQVLQYFMKRHPNGAQVFPHLPLNNQESGS